MDTTPAAAAPVAAPAVLNTPSGTVVTGPGGGNTTPPAAQEQRPPLNVPATATEGQPFVLPEAWKDKPWAAKIKNQEDVYKQLDNLDTMVGKKTVMPDLDAATPEEREAFYAQTRPKDIAAYKFEGDDVAPEYAKGVAEMMSKHGITAAQGNALFNDYKAFEAVQIANATSQDGFNAEMKKSFGDKFEPAVAAITTEMKARLSPEDQALTNAMPNEYYGVMARMIDNMMKEYGVSETGKGANKPGTVPPVENVEATRVRLSKELAELESRPHTAEERQRIIDARAATFK